MGLYTSYYLYQKYEQREGQDSIPCTPNVYSVDGQGTMQKVIKLDNDPECGYTPEPTEPIYRWYQIPITEDYICDECPELQYRWVDSGTTCVGYDKWNRSIQQYSEDNGATWHNTNPPVYSATSLIEVDSEDCGYVPPIPTRKKFIASYIDGTTREVDCNDNATLTSGETQPSGYNTSAMTSAVISDCVSRLGHYVFQNCISLSAVSIPNEVSYIGWYAFNGCTSLTSIKIPNGITRINEYTFLNCINLKRINSNVDGVFNIPSGVTYIGESAFQDCRNLTSINIPSGVTTIHTQTFHNCSGLTSVTIPNSVTSIGNAAFNRCKSLTSVTIPSSITSIGDGAFGACNGLTSVTIPNSVTSIDNSAFWGCNGLTSVTCLATTPPTLGTDVFYNTNCPIYVPAASVSSYQSASGWSNYASRIQAIT